MRLSEAILALVGLVILWSLVRAHRDPRVSINLFDLVMSNGRLSKVSVGYMVTLIVTSWVLIRSAADGKLSDTVFAAYGAMWVGPLITRLLKTTPEGKKE